MAAPAPLSPLAPKKYPSLPPIEGVRFATAAAGMRYPGRTDVMLALFDKRPRSPACSRARNARRRRSTGAARIAARQGAGAGRQFRQRQRLHRRHRRERGRRTSPRRRARRRARRPNEIFMASTGVIGEPLDGAKSPPCSTNSTQGAGRRPDGRRESDHDDRHFSQSRDGAASRSARRKSSSTASPKAPA